MSIDAPEYARLSNDSYTDRSKELASGDSVSLQGSDIEYKVIAVVRSTGTDYQGTAYRRTDTGEVIIAHRGTESLKDGLADAGMVFNGRNSQLDDAVKFTEEAMAIAQRIAGKDSPLHVSITGHSLGGTLAAITAAKYKLHAETFNAYGPGVLVNLERYGVDVHAPHPNIVNHVRATDVVGAGGLHLGQVKTYAAAQDIDNLRRGRYVGGSLLPGNPLLAADIAAHSMANFLPGNAILGESVMSPVNEARARAHAGPIAQYQHDVVQGRIDLHTVINGRGLIPAISTLRLGVQTADAAGTVGARTATQAMVSGAQTAGQGARAVGQAAGQAYIVTRDSVMTGAQRAGMALDETGRKIHGGAAKVIEKLTPAKPWLGSEASPALRLDQPGHPGHGLYKQSLAGLEKINVERGIPSDQRTCNAAGALASAACRSSLTQIDLVAVNDSGDKLIAVQGRPDDAFSKITYVETTVALDTPLAQSSQAFAEVLGQQQTQPSQTINVAVQAPAAMSLS